MLTELHMFTYVNGYIVYIVFLNFSILKDIWTSGFPIYAKLLTTKGNMVSNYMSVYTTH